MSWNPASPVLSQSRRTPDRLALHADEAELSYAGLADRARRLAAALRGHGIGRGSRVGILGSRSLEAVLAVLGISWSGATYVPLGLKWPARRLEAALSLCPVDAVVADRGGLALLGPAVLKGVKLLLLPDARALRSVAAGAGRDALSLADLPDAEDAAEPAPMARDDLVYVIFTSGTTGTPKAVKVPAGAVAAYLAALGRRKAMTPEDRASQFTELSFDPALGEIFLPWYAGASLHVVPPVARMSPARFIRERRLTVWGSAPSAIAWMRDTRALQPGSFPGLRYSSFGGEPLSLSAVRAWQAAAPNSAIDNLYGPTEATVDCAGQLIAPGADPVVTPGRGILAIGTPHPGTELAVFGPDRRPLPPGSAGELAIAGEQLSLGYLAAPELTAARFPMIAGRRWYLTGDLAMQDERGLFHHLGRIDNQIKIHGHRVELEEIEAQLRELSGSDQVAAVAWPVEDGVARAIVGFVASGTLPPGRLREALRERLPPHMVPAEIQEIASLPLNANGKLDRAALVARLEAAREDGDARPRR